jgi:hypothetical protein
MPDHESAMAAELTELRRQQWRAGMVFGRCGRGGRTGRSS